MHTVVSSFISRINSLRAYSHQEIAGAKAKIDQRTIAKYQKKPDKRKRRMSFSISLSLGVNGPQE